jgi:hypothetical protein
MDLNFSISGLIGGLLFGTYGLYLIKRGKKDGEMPLMAIGFVLLVYPYFIDNNYLLWGLGSFLVGLVYVHPW